MLVQLALGLTAGVWPHAAAVVVRQALEATLGAFWRLRARETVEYSFRDRWTSLPAHLGDRPAAREADLATVVDALSA